MSFFLIKFFFSETKNISSEPLECVAIYSFLILKIQLPVTEIRLFKVDRLVEKVILLSGGGNSGNSLISATKKTVFR